MDILHASIIIEDTIKKIEQLRNMKFEETFNKIKEKCGSLLLRKKASLSPETFNTQLYNQTFDNIIVQMKERFMSFNNLEFVQLLNGKKFKSYNISFPQKAFQSLKINYRSYFDFPRLRSELCIAYSNKIFAKDNVEEILKYLLENKISECLKELYRLIILTLTIPISSASVERSF